MSSQDILACCCCNSWRVICQIDKYSVLSKCTLFQQKPLFKLSGIYTSGIYLLRWDMSPLLHKMLLTVAATCIRRSKYWGVHGLWKSNSFKVLLGKSFEPGEYLWQLWGVYLQLLYDVVFRYVLGCFVMKAGIRKCNFQYFMCGKDMVSPVFSLSITLTIGNFLFTLTMTWRWCQKKCMIMYAVQLEFA